MICRVHIEGARHGAELAMFLSEWTSDFVIFATEEYHVNQSRMPMPYNTKADS